VSGVERFILNGRDSRLVKLPPSGSPFYMPDELVRAESYETLSRRVAELEGALRALVELYALPGESNSDRFERVAELYNRETGRYAPGKDVPFAAHDDEAYEDRIAQWEAWYAARAAKGRAALKGQG
jgi:hypothetical protein